MRVTHQELSGLVLNVLIGDIETICDVRATIHVGEEVSVVVDYEAAQRFTIALESEVVDVSRATARDINRDDLSGFSRAQYPVPRATSPRPSRPCNQCQQP